jgi:hypothetical protein
MIIVPVDCSRWVRRVSCRVAGMKQVLLMIAVVALVGCGKKEHTKAKATAGVKLWEFETGDIVYSSPAIGSDGTVYVGSDDNKLYAIKTDSKGPARSPWPMFSQNARYTGRALKK